MLLCLLLHMSFDFAEIEFFFSNKQKYFFPVNQTVFYTNKRMPIQTARTYSMLRLCMSAYNNKKQCFELFEMQ